MPVYYISEKAGTCKYLVYATNELNKQHVQAHTLTSCLGMQFAKKSGNNVTNW